MSLYHRFCAFIPLFLVIAFLAGCEAGPGAWVPKPSQTASVPANDVRVTNAPNIPSVAPSPFPGPQSAGGTKVAILLPLSGPNAGIGQSMLQAAQLAVFDVGTDAFELISKDTGGTPQGASAAATAALSEGASIILGPLFAEEVRAVKLIAASRNINVLAFSTDWTLAGGNVYVMGFTPFGQVERIASYAQRIGLRKVAVAAPADTYGTAVSSAFEQQAPRHGLSITRALSDPMGYDSVFIPAGGQALPPLLMRVANKGAKKLGTGLWDDARLAADPAMNGAIFAAPSPSARRGFEQKYQSTYGSAPVRISSLAYDATALAIALSSSGYTAQSLKNPNGFAGVDGIMRFGGNGLIERGLAVLEIKDGRITEIDPAPAAF